jgi:hypothetical protein
MAIVGSWRDTLPDDVILDELRTWNAGRSLALDISFALFHVASAVTPRNTGNSPGSLACLANRYFRWT